MSAVLVELGALVALGAAGWLLATPSWGPSWRLAIALPLGAAAHTATELVLLATQLRIAWPWVALALTVVVAGAVAHRTDRLALVPQDRRFVGYGLLIVLAAVALTALVPLANVTADSFRYITAARLLSVDGDASTTSSFLLQTRGLTMGALHGLATAEPGYLRAFGPLIAVSTLGATGLLVAEGTGRLAPSLQRLLLSGAVLLLLTNHRFVFNALYVNGHMLFAAWLLLLAAVSWRLLRDRSPQPATPEAALTAALLAVGLTVLRPEGALVAATALVPVVVAPAVPIRWRRQVLVAFGLGIVLWHLPVLAPLDLRFGRTPPASTLALAAVGGATVLVALLLPLPDRWLGRRPLAKLHVLAWLAVVVLALRTPSLLVDSAKATARNLLGAGGWGTSLLLLAALVVVAVVLRHRSGEGALLFPLLTFVPLGILLAFFREGAYRVGPGDSLNRMLLHILPLAVLTLVVTADSESRQWRRRRARTSAEAT